MVTKQTKTDIEFLQETGELAFGAQWRRHLAAEIGVSHSLISMILHRKMEMSGIVKINVIAYLDRLAQEFEARAHEARALRARWLLKESAAPKGD